MRHHFYGDKYDLRKWSLLLKLADENGARILYIAMLTDYGPDSDVDPRAWSYFRNLGGIAGLDSRIDFCDENFSHKNRDAYFFGISHRLSQRSTPVIAFLDPDTGIAPQKATADHVTIEEIGVLWSYLKPGDVLVIYQHGDHTKDSFVRKKAMLENALGNQCAMHTFKDVAFFVSAR
jgi:hypothetical protein